MDYSQLRNKVQNINVCKDVLISQDIELLPLVNAVFELRKEHFGKEVMIHILNNVQNGRCPEDCSYCAQSKLSKAHIEEYSMKSDEEILEEAKQAYEKGAFRYCMVFSGKGPTKSRIDHLAEIIRTIKSKYPIEVCVSPGVIDRRMAKTLKNAGLNRLNHNINTSKSQYSKICTTHTYEDRINTIRIAKDEGLQICSGVIIGMGESIDEIIEMAIELKNNDADSIPVNFFIPIEGTKLEATQKLTPEFCLRVLCLFRLLNPKADIRVAAGRELHLKSLQPLAFYAANSLFLNGYLNAKGENNLKTIQMLLDSGFSIKSEVPIDEIIANNVIINNKDANNPNILKSIKELRPTLVKE